MNNCTQLNTQGFTISKHQKFVESAHINDNCFPEKINFDGMNKTFP